MQRINGPRSLIESMEKKSGISFLQAQVALVRKWLVHKHTSADVPHHIDVKLPSAVKNTMALSPEHHHVYSPLTKALMLSPEPSSHSDSNTLTADSSGHSTAVGTGTTSPGLGLGLNLAPGPTINRTSSEGGKTPTERVQRVVVPRTYEEAAENVERFECAAPRSDDAVADTVGQHAQADTTGLTSEQWLGTQQEELDA